MMMMKVLWCTGAGRAAAAAAQRRLVDWIMCCVDSGATGWQGRRSSNCSTSGVCRQSSSDTDRRRYWRRGRSAGDTRCPPLRRRWSTRMASTASVRCAPSTQVSGWTTASHFSDHSAANITTPLYTQPVQRHLKRTASRRQSTVLSLSEFIELTNIIIHGYNERLL